MVKYLIPALVMVAILAMVKLVKADEVKVSDVLGHLNFHSGIAYDSYAHGVVNTETIRVIGYSGVRLDPSIDAGWASNDKFAVGASISLLKLKDLGIDVPVLNLINLRPQVLYGWGSINLHDIAGSKNTVMYGASIIDVKW